MIIEKAMKENLLLDTDNTIKTQEIGVSRAWVITFFLLSQL